MCSLAYRHGRLPQCHDSWVALVVVTRPSPPSPFTWFEYQKNVGRHSSSCLAGIATEEGASGRSQAPGTTTTTTSLALALALVVGCSSNRRDRNDGLQWELCMLICHDSRRGGRLGIVLTRKMDLKDTILTGFFLWFQRVAVPGSDVPKMKYFKQLRWLLMEISKLLSKDSKEGGIPTTYILGYTHIIIIIIWLRT